jgi:PLP dependent protein
MMSSVAENLLKINRQIEAACSRTGRDAAGVSLIGVTKTVSVNRIREGIEAGIKILGENYVQEAVQKMQALSDPAVSWHFIGHLQSNKAKAALEAFACIQTLDRESLARELDRAAQRRGEKIPVLIQVNTGYEGSKSGLAPEALFPFFELVLSLDGLEARGLMALPPYYEDPEEVRPHFRKLRELLERLRDRTADPERLSELSMGMSHDFEAAVEEGATMVRIGTALFGTRPAS